MEGKQLSKCMLAMAAIAIGVEAAAVSVLSKEQSQEIKTVTYEPIPIMADFEWAADQGQMQWTNDIQLLTQEDRDLMLRCAAAEGANQGEDGMWLIMSVIMNRVADEEFPDTIREVIYQPHQFSVVSDGRIDNVEPTEAAEMALIRIEEGQIAPELIAFERVDSNVLDVYFMPAFEYKDHKFFTKKER